MVIRLIVGLSNPGDKYAETRHNAGAWFVYMMANKLFAPLRKKSKFYGFTSNINLVGIDVHFLVQTTFMNLSGVGVAAISEYYNIQPHEILVAHDELDFPPGITKFKMGGGHGGHNGLKDIIEKLNNNRNFYRLRIGIGHPGNKNEVVNFVLSKPSLIEQELINQAIKKAISYTEKWLKKVD